MMTCGQEQRENSARDVLNTGETVLMSKSGPENRGTGVTDHMRTYPPELWSLWLDRGRAGEHRGKDRNNA